MKQPRNEHAEISLLGAAMLLNKPTDLRAIVEYVNPDWLYLPKHTIIFEAMMKLAEEGKSADLVTLKHALGGSIRQVGGYEYLMQCQELCPVPENWRFYADICEESFIRRLSILRAKEIALAAEGDDLQALLQKIQGIGQGLHKSTTNTAWVSDVIGCLDKPRSAQGISSGFHCIDEATACRGIPRGEMTFIFADTNKGKTAMMGRLILNIAEAGSTCGWATYEMSKEELTWRLMKHLTGFSDVPGNLFDRAGWDSARKNLELIDRDLCYHDASENEDLFYVEELCSWASMMQRAHHMEVLFVDYAQLLTSRQRTNSEREDLQLVSRYLKTLARKTGIAIVVGAQVTQNKDAKLTAMGSRRFEQDAGLVIEVDCDTGVKIGKNRHGLRNIVMPMEWDSRHVTFRVNNSLIDD